MIKYDQYKLTVEAEWRHPLRLVVLIVLRVNAPYVYPSRQDVVSIFDDEEMPKKIANWLRAHGITATISGRWFGGNWQELNV